MSSVVRLGRVHLKVYSPEELKKVPIRPPVSQNKKPIQKNNESVFNEAIYLLKEIEQVGFEREYSDNYVQVKVMKKVKDFLRRLDDLQSS